ncbi:MULTISPECIES: hypothetical protein [Streptomyces]|uniref:Uncharacterized protein n=1 Tax=Streptomyces muensis TaxID=1077944 RepID=A0A9X1TJB8_STRM4|nr:MULTISPECIES: hypothetical protein [Streptomyces]MCF1592434.1 hypothetical protein [Streptomyces muensis]QKV98179.1 hypothetical protein HUT19_41395 [Streptomyces sp. NA02950]
MYTRLLRRLQHQLQRLADRLLMPKPSQPAPVYVRLHDDTAIDAETVPDWDGNYLGRLTFGGVVLEGDATELARLAQELHIASEVAAAAKVIDAGRSGTLSPSGGEG